METILIFVTLVALLVVASHAYAAYRRLRMWDWQFTAALRRGLDKNLCGDRMLLSILWLVAAAVSL